MLSSLLARIAQRCPTHDRTSYSKTRRLEQALGMPPSPAPASFTDEHYDPDLIECGHTWCRRR